MSLEGENVEVLEDDVVHEVSLEPTAEVDWLVEVVDAAVVVVDVVEAPP